MTVLTTPMGCRWCGIPYRDHAQSWIEGVGWHGWTEPTREQIAERLRKRLKPRTTTKE